MSMTQPTIILQKVEGSDITIDMLKEAAKLFSNHYGVWSPNAAIHMGPFAKAGRRVRINARKLEEQCLPRAARNTLVRVFVADQLAGHVCAARWVFEGSNICWITQLVVHRSYRRMGLATRLLKSLRADENDRGFGILSSHPAAICAALRAFGQGLGNIDDELPRVHGRAILDSSPADYVRAAKLPGSVLSANDDGTICYADTGFFVDHQEILEALATVNASGQVWPYGELPEGHEFLVILKCNAVYTNSDILRAGEAS